MVLPAGVGAGEATDGLPAASARGISPAVAIETTRFMMDEGAASSANPRGAVSLSPDGRTYVARLIRGDLTRNGAWMEMIAANLDSLESAAEYRTVAQLFSTGLGAGEGKVGANLDSLSGENPLRWIDADRVAILWSDERSVRQVLLINIRTSKSESLTRHPTSVVTYDVGQDGTVLYCAQAADPQHDSSALLRSGFVLDPDTDASSLIAGRINAGSIIDRLSSVECFVKVPSETVPRRLEIAGRAKAPTRNQEMSLAPIPHWGLIKTNAPKIHEQWDTYDDVRLRARLYEARHHPGGPVARSVFQYWVIDTESGDSHALWHAPAEGETRAAWSPDGRRVLLAPTFLPLEDLDPRGRRGIAAAVVDRQSGRYQVLPVDLDDMSLVRIRWYARNAVELELRAAQGFETRRFEQLGTEWHPVSAQPVRHRIHITSDEDLNTPPRLVAVDAGRGLSRTIIDPNPGLTTRFDLGRVQPVGDQLADGTRWEGLLMYPVGYRSGERYPLVIQSVYGARISDEFTLYGTQNGYGLGPPPISPYSGRSLSGLGFFVLTVNVAGDATMRTPAEPVLRQQLFESAARRLVNDGLVDGEKVGLVGFSRNGYYVEYALTHSQFAFAAAVAADHFDVSYTAQTLLGYDAGGAAVNGGLPFGAGLQRWIENAPGFAAEQVHTPLLQIEQSRGVLGLLLKWELHSRLRYLQKPVEMYVVPSAAFGVHNSQNPEQIVAVQARTIDWFRFWLQGVEDNDIRKQAQYERWRKMRVLQGD